MKELLNEVLQALYSKVYADQERHWDTHIFQADHWNQTPYDKYMESFGADDAALIQRIYEALAELEE